MSVIKGRRCSNCQQIFFYQNDKERLGFIRRNGLTGTWCNRCYAKGYEPDKGLVPHNDKEEMEDCIKSLGINHSTRK